MEKQAELQGNGQEPKRLPDGTFPPGGRWRRRRRSSRRRSNSRLEVPHRQFVVDARNTRFIRDLQLPRRGHFFGPRCRKKRSFLCPSFARFPRGCFHNTMICTTKSITDGASNTLLIGEKWLYYQWYNNRTSGGGSCIDDQGWCNGWDNDSICFSGTNSTISGYTTSYPYGGTLYYVPPVQDPTSAWTCGFVFGSAHAGSFGCLFCDGTVRFVAYTINPATFHNLCARNDGETIDFDSF